MDENILQKFINGGLSTYDIASKLNSSQTNVRHWLKKYGLKTKRATGVKVYLCKLCGEADKSKFHNKGHGQISYTKCKECHNKYTIQRVRNTKLKAIEYKGGKCEKCGYNKCAGSLQFHHLNPKEKDPNWRHLRNRKFEEMKKEIDKCILVCANCHGEIHWSE